jgi:hypothetical protein
METEGILVIEPVSAFSVDDFRGLTVAVDAYLTEHPTLHGMLIHACGYLSALPRFLAMVTQ